MEVPRTIASQSTASSLIITIPSKQQRTTLMNSELRLRESQIAQRFDRW